MTQSLDLDKPQGKHLCAQYSSETELAALMAAFVREGLEAGEKVGWVTGADLATVTERLVAVGVAREAAVREGALVIISLTDGESDNNGSHVPRVGSLVQAFVEEGLCDGYPALRIASEVHALAPEQETVGQMAAREALADQLTASLPITGLCLYDRRRFSDQFLAEAVRAHSDEPAEDLLYMDDILILTRYLGRPGLCVKGAVDSFNAEFLRELLESVADLPSNQLTLSLTELRFIDVAGLRAIVETATSRPGTCLFLQDVSPLVVRMLSLCGWADLPNLAVCPTGHRG